MIFVEYHQACTLSLGAVRQAASSVDEDGAQVNVLTSQDTSVVSDMCEVTQSGACRHDWSSVMSYVCMHRHGKRPWDQGDTCVSVIHTLYSPSGNYLVGRCLRKYFG